MKLIYRILMLGIVGAIFHPSLSFAVQENNITPQTDVTRGLAPVFHKGFMARPAEQAVLFLKRSPAGCNEVYLRHLADPAREVQVTGFEGGACTDKLDPAWGPYIPANFARPGGAGNASIQVIGISANQQPEFNYVTTDTWLVTYSKELGASTPQACSAGCRIFTKAIGPDLTAASVEAYAQSANGLEVQLTFPRYQEAASNDRKPQFELLAGITTNAQPPRYSFTFVRQDDPSSRGHDMIYIGVWSPSISATEALLTEGSVRAADNDPNNDPAAELQLPGSVINVTTRHSGFCAANGFANIPEYDFDDPRWYPNGLNLVATAQINGFSQLVAMSLLEGNFTGANGRPVNTAALCTPTLLHYTTTDANGNPIEALGSTVFPLTSSAENHELPQVSPYMLYEVNAGQNQSADVDHVQYGILYHVRTNAGSQIRAISTFHWSPESGSDLTFVASAATNEQIIGVTGTDAERPVWGNRATALGIPNGGAPVQAWIGYDAISAAASRQVFGALVGIAPYIGVSRMPPRGPVPQTPTGAPINATLVREVQWSNCQTNQSVDLFSPQTGAVVTIAVSGRQIGLPGSFAEDHRLSHYSDLTDPALNTACPAICRDGIPQAGEQCDDGNVSNADACVNMCVAAACGDGFLQVGIEQCDDNNTANNDACSSTCRNIIPCTGTGCGPTPIGTQGADLRIEEDILSSSGVVLTDAAGAAAVTQNAWITYTVRVTNSGPRVASNLVVTNELTRDLPFTTNTVSLPAGCTVTDQAFRCTVPQLGIGEEFTLRFGLSPQGAGTLTHTARVTGGQEDPNGVNNQDSSTLRVNPLAVTNPPLPDPQGEPDEPNPQTGTPFAGWRMKGAFSPVEILMGIAALFALRRSSRGGK